MANGTFQLAGVQIDTASAGQLSLGPFALAFGPTTNVQTVLVNTQSTVPMPSGAFGVAIIPPVGNTTPTLQISFVSYANALGNYIAPGSPTVIEFDAAHVPANLYLVSGGSVSVVVQSL
jgi:hypothetical protein